MLSSQTKDEIAGAAVRKLQAMPGGLTPESILAMKESVLAKELVPVGFYSRKASYLQRTCRILIDKYGSDIPDTVQGLCELPGVGPKMAHLTILNAWHRADGIGVDVHVHRICN